MLLEDQGEGEQLHTHMWNPRTRTRMYGMPQNALRCHLTYQVSHRLTIFSTNPQQPQQPQLLYICETHLPHVVNVHEVCIELQQGGRISCRPKLLHLAQHLHHCVLHKG